MKKIHIQMVQIREAVVMDTQSQAEKKRALSEKPEVLRLVDTYMADQ